MEHGVHGGHAQDVLIAVEAVKGPGLQEIPLGAAQLVADADLAHRAVGRHLFVDEFGAGVGQQHVLVGGDQKAAGAAGRVADGAADLGIDHLGQHPDQVARGAELGRLLLSAQLAGQVFEEVALDIGIHTEKGDGRDDVHRPPQGRPVGDNDGGVAENGPRPLGELRVLGQQRQGVAQSAQHGLVVWI